MGYPVPQTSYSSGELAPALRGRVDLAKFRTGLQTMLNWYSLVHGGATTRPGWEFVDEIIDSNSRGRLIRFKFSTTDTYSLEFGNLKMRVIRNGAYVLETAKTVTAITKANPGKMTVATHGFITGDRLDIATITGMTQLTGKTVAVTVVDAGSFTIGIDTTAFSTFTAGTVARYYTLVTPYLAADLARLKTVQSFDKMTITHPSYFPMELTRTAHTNWTLLAITFRPTQAAPTGITSSSGGAGNIYAVTAINDATGEESLQSADVLSTTQTSTLTIPGMVGVSLFSVYKAKNGVYGLIGNAKPTSAGAAATFTDATNDQDFSQTPPQQRNPFGNGSITGAVVTSGGAGYSAPAVHAVDGAGSGATFSVASAAGVITGVTVLSAGRNYSPNTTLVISDGAGAGCVLSFTYAAGTNPPWLYIDTATVVSGGAGYHSGATVQITRSDGLVMAQAFALTVLAGVVTACAVINAGDSFAFYDNASYFVSSATVIDSAGTGAVITPTITLDATAYPGLSTYWAQRGFFFATKGNPQGLWSTQTGNFKNMSVSSPTRDTDAITKTLASREVNEVRGAVPLSDLLMFTSGGVWVGTTNGAVGVTPASLDLVPNIDTPASHMPPIAINSDVLFNADMTNQVLSVAFAFQTQKYQSTDVSILSRHLLTGYTLVEWANAQSPHQLIWAVRNDGVLLAFTFMKEQDIYAWSQHTTDGTFESICSVPEGSEDAVYAIVNRTINGVTKRYVERMQSRLFPSLTESWCVDCGLRYGGAPASVISGLDHLEGKTVSILADGVVLAPQVVAGGSITLPGGVTASVVIVGLGYVCDLQTLPIEAGPPTIAGKLKRVVAVALRLLFARGLRIGPNADQLVVVQPGSTFGAVGTLTELFSGLKRVLIPANWNTDGSVFIRQQYPLPATLLADVPEIEVGNA